MDVRDWILGEHDDGANRLRNQVFGCVPLERRGEQPGGGNSILYGSLHIARHADVALSVLSGAEVVWGEFRGLASGPGAGLEEAEADWSSSLDPVDVDHYLENVLSSVREALAGDWLDLDRVPNTAAALERLKVPEDRFGWLHKMWGGQPASWFVRWPLLGHIANHTGEMIATRNRMGLSPF